MTNQLVKDHRNDPAAKAKAQALCDELGPGWTPKVQSQNGLPMAIHEETDSWCYKATTQYQARVGSFHGQGQTCKDALQSAVKRMANKRDRMTDIINQVSPPAP